MKYVLKLILIGWFFLNLTCSTLAYTTGQAASVVIGQPDFTSGSANQGGAAGANTINYVFGVATDGTRLAIGDSASNRVLIYNTIPTTNNASADLVLGQANFTSTSANRGGSAAANTLNQPTQVAFVGSKFLVADYSNNRILIWNTFPTSNGQAADVVVGQPDMTTNSAGTTSSKMSGAEGVSYDSVSGKLVVTDYSNNRVLIFNSIPTSNGAVADVVVGQQNMTSGNANQGGSVGANTFYVPYIARIIQSKLMVADTNNHRILIYNSIPTTNNASADVVIGQPNMTSNGGNQGGSVGANTLSYPSDMIYDGSKLFIQDSSNYRILIYNSIPTTNNASADTVLGQTDLTSNSAGTTASKFDYVEGGLATTTECGKLIVGDSYNNRVLIFNNDTPCPAATSTPTPTPTSTSGSSSTSSSSSDSSSEAPKPQIPQQTVIDVGGAFTAGGDSSTEGQHVISIIQPHTFNFDAFLSSYTQQPSSLVSLINPITQQPYPRFVTNAKVYGKSDDHEGILGISLFGTQYYQVGHIQNIWYKAYAPGYKTDNAPRIIPELQDKPSIVALSYTQDDLIIPGRQPQRGVYPTYNPSSFKLAYSPDGHVWNTLPTSVVDTENKTVAALHKPAGYYMIVAR
jgi:hypothetical protein